jgi:hypothetical protein
MLWLLVDRVFFRALHSPFRRLNACRVEKRDSFRKRTTDGKKKF